MYNESQESSQPKMYSSTCVTSVQHFNIAKDKLTSVHHILFNESLVKTLKYKNEFGEQETEQKMDSCVTSVQQLNYKIDMDSSDISKHPLSPASVNKSLVTSLKRKIGNNDK